VAPVTCASNDRIARCARWLVDTPPSQYPPVSVFVYVMRDYFKLTTAELILAEREADRLRREAK